MDRVEFAAIGTRCRIAILGAGSWGTALAALLAANDHAIRLWARDPLLVAALRKARENTRYLPGFRLPASISPTEDMAEALTEVEVVVFAVPSGAVREVAEEAASLLGPDVLLLS